MKDSISMDVVLKLTEKLVVSVEPPVQYRASIAPRLISTVFEFTLI